MKRALQILFGAIFVWMIVMTTRTSLEQNPWSVATLWDAYFGFVTFYVWVFAKEHGWVSRVEVKQAHA